MKANELKVYKWSFYVDPHSGQLDLRGERAFIIIGATGKAQVRALLRSYGRYPPPIVYLSETRVREEVDTALSHPGVPFWREEFIRGLDGQLSFNKTRGWKRLHAPDRPESASFDLERTSASGGRERR